MFDKQMFKQLEKMLGQMTPKQKEKLANIMKDEQSLKQALSNIDPEKAKQVTEELNMPNVSVNDLEKMAKDFSNKPESIRNIEKDL